MFSVFLPNTCTTAEFGTLREEDRSRCRNDGTEPASGSKNSHESLIMSVELAVVFLVLCLIAGVLGRKRRIGFWGFFFASIIFTPIITLLFLFFATPRKT